MKLLIADDEALVIEGLMDSIDWAGFGIERCLTATNGKDAYELALQHEPDIIITDIRMPKMDGLELIGRVRELQPDCVFIVYSGYSDFEYAKKSIELDVVYYMLKPSAIAEIEDALNKALARRRAMIEQRRTTTERGLYRKWDEAQRLRGALKGMPADGDERFGEAYAVLCAGVHALEPAPALQQLGAELGAHDWCKDADLGERGLTAVVLHRHALQAARLVVGCGQQASSAGQQAPNDERQTSNDGSRTSNDERQTPSVLCVGLSGPVASASELPQAYDAAQLALHDAIYTGVPMCAASEPRPFRAVALAEWKRSLAAYPHTLHGLRQMVGALEQQSLQAPPERRQFVQQFMEAATLLFQWIEREIGQTAEKLMDSRYMFQRALAEPVSIRACMAWLHELLGAVETHVGHHGESFQDRTIDKLKAYMSDHLAEDISLVSLADIAHMNPAYLSSLFKKKNGVGISEYLLSIRMERAKRLLRESPYKIGEIAARSGFADQRYFSAVFKKYTGVTAGEYRDGKM